jgi:hypothetical protein
LEFISTPLRGVAIKLNCYVPNQGGKNTKKKWMENRSISLNEILDGKHPQYQTYKLVWRPIKNYIASVVELEYTFDLKSNAERIEGSNPSARTIRP